MRGALPAQVRQEWDGEAWAIAQVDAASVPALVARNTGELLAVNAQADALLERGALTSALRALISDTCVIDRTQIVRLTREGNAADPAPRAFDLTLMPVPLANVLVVAREVTLEANLIGALTSSRELFRDLALCSTDFAFETDASGVFAWVSPGGALGYAATELHGARPRDVFGDGEGVEVFSSRTPVKDQEIRCAGKGRPEACVALTVVPVVDAQGVWCGARGVARDVTALRTHERAAAHVRRREELIGATVGAMRGQIEPRRMMMAAADALLAATDSACVTVRPKNLDLFARVGQAVDGAKELTATTSYQGAINGSLTLSRQPGEPGFGADEKALLDAVLPHLGIAIALAESLSALASQSRADPLTGLMNRRGFFGEGARRLGLMARAARSGALIVVDCDRFQALNDALGESKGDEALCAFSEMLAAACGERGVAARLGDNRFALLLEDADGDAARGAAERIRKDYAGVGAKLGFKGATLSLGVAFIESEAGEGFEDVLTRAKDALAGAKKEGGDRVVVALPNGGLPC
jgi:diguanylate cyclase (GGDEF)-like protein